MIIEYLYYFNLIQSFIDNILINNNYNTYDVGGCLGEEKVVLEGRCGW
jgi:hypothetical protein